MDEKTFDLRPFIILFAACVFSVFCLELTYETLFRWQFAVVFLMSAVVFAALFKSLDFDGITVILFVGILLKFTYIFYTATWTRQHDVVDFGTGEGHAGYIEYLLEHEALPDFDPRDVWAFFQPPLHHIISALWLKILLYTGMVYRQAQESIQLLTFFYTSATMLFSYFICKELKLKMWGMRVAMLIISFHPIMVIMSGSINNDALSLMFMVISIYLTILWYKDPKIKYIILLALSIGLAMFAKLSGALVAPAIGIIFIVKLVRQEKKWFRLVLQYVIFALICVPVGMYWSIRNMMNYDMPINYIPPVGEEFSYTLAQRLFDFSSTSVFMAMKESKDAFYEHNIFLAIIKSSLFDDAKLTNEMPMIVYPANVLFFVSVILILISFAATIYVLAKKSEFASEWKILLGGIYVTVIVAYLSFALSYNNFSAQSFRYAALSIIIEAIFLGVFTDSMTKDGEGRIYGYAIPIICYVFAAASFATYFIFGFARFN